MVYEYKGYEICIERKPKTYIYKESVISDGDVAPEGCRYFKYLIRKYQSSVIWDTVLCKNLTEVKKICHDFIDNEH